MEYFVFQGVGECRGGDGEVFRYGTVPGDLLNCVGVVM